MTRYKKYCREHGLRTGEDYPYFPIDIGGVILESIRVHIDNNHLFIDHYFTSLVTRREVLRDGSVINRDYMDYYDFELDAVTNFAEVI